MKILLYRNYTALFYL